MKFKKIIAGVIASALTLTTFYVPEIFRNITPEFNTSAESYGDYLEYSQIDEDDDGTCDYVEINDCDQSAVTTTTEPTTTESTSTTVNTDVITDEQAATTESAATNRSLFLYLSSDIFKIFI